MNEHYFQKKSKQTVGLIGYILGLVILTVSVYFIFADSAQWTTYVMMGCLGIIVTYLGDIVLSSNARTDLMLRIMKRQEALYRQFGRSQAPSFPSDPLGILKNMMGKKEDDQKKPGFTGMSISMDEEGMKLSGDAPPPELLDVLKKITGALRDAIEKDTGKPLEKMTVDELQTELDKAIKNEDYDRAGVLRDEINRRKSEDGE
jgi:hypothetical protein